MGCGGGYPSAFDQSFLGKKKSKFPITPNSSTNIEKKMFYKDETKPKDMRTSWESPLSKERKRANNIHSRFMK